MSVSRYYTATKVRCPECLADPGVRCIGPDGRFMRGVHRRRDIAYNREAAWPRDRLGGAPPSEPDDR